MYKRISFVGPYPNPDRLLIPRGSNHKSASPYGAPSLVGIVTAFGEKLFAIDTAGIVAVIVVEAFAVPPVPLHAIE